MLLHVNFCVISLDSMNPTLKYFSWRKKIPECLSKVFRRACTLASVPKTMRQSNSRRPLIGRFVVFPQTLPALFRKSANCGERLGIVWSISGQPWLHTWFAPWDFFCPRNKGTLRSYSYFADKKKFSKFWNLNEFATRFQISKAASISTGRPRNRAWFSWRQPNVVRRVGTLASPPFCFPVKFFPDSSQILPRAFRFSTALWPF